MKTLVEADLKGKRVLYRPDYNVPVKDGEIVDDYRIKSTFPTLDYLMDQKCKIIIASHLGRPDGHRMAEYDLKPVAQCLADHYNKRKVLYAEDAHDPWVKKSIDNMNGGDILVLPNVRYYPEEEDNAPGFAKTLANLADVYVNDAFACDHRAHASVVGVAKFLPSYAGFLVEKEVKMLGGLLENPVRPFVVIMGGAKVSDKIEVIQSLGKMADKLLIGGAMANTFALAKGENIGQSKAEGDKRHLAETLMEDLGEKIVLPVDFVKDNPDDQEGFRYMDLGPGTIDSFKQELKGAKTIFWNGSLGYIEDEKYAVSTDQIAKYIASLKGVTTVVAGGDTVETITKLNLHKDITFVSTGGGAALELLAGKILPGIEVLD